MKRLTYISKFSRPLSPKEVEEIGQVSRRNNQRDGITGVLLCSGGIFFQILEGEAEKIDNLYKKILKDDRHTDILCLKSELNVRTRMFPDWSMQTIILDNNKDLLIKPIDSLLKTVTRSHRILEKYTQSKIFAIISQGINPLSVRPVKAEKVILFGDIISFSTFAEKLPVEEVVDLVNNYFSIATKIITRQGGEVSKFIGDCIMAYFDGDRADNAIQAGVEILEELAILRNSVAPDSPLRFLYTGMGLAKGKVIEGNIGSALKKEYTIIGDAVNVASRLEALTRHLTYAMVFSVEVKNSAKKSWDFIKIDNYQVKGKSNPVEIYSINDEGVKKEQKLSAIAQEIRHFLNQFEG
ncbi:BLUF domain-containing protein [Oxynema sp. CENA135]|uniref:BLUF domain-containing protein n=1 Tax=Oxynema sp. CENA135 TaxID=984206 RepID=UPI00190C04C7|nr:BLUF domain-containing protein [Oxynema sp. CENA135]MBK4730696.1 BLUF domain-containing protein [Oxynema sp. CENA135]